MSTRSGRPATRRSVALLAAPLLILAAVIAVGSMWYGYAQDADAEFSGADGQAEEVIGAIEEGYEPWFSPLVGELPGEVESGLFALQAGIGGIALGAAVGWYAGRARGRRETAPAGPGPVGESEGDRGGH
ncbi:energy-coupling factor ABC transporter substrate-binding protein [Mycolicibacterium thermoresistibile]|jgi:cobalt/nickel transport protein|uniref:Cobalt transport protein CbiN n=1 Tax=Mycolicibacterium thermoresistibile TaxID=1797 RepID=A0A117IN64_MYCTH|nr:cobalt transport protein CbiN [Mycolicibacterium thermoresistibile]MCV7187102.1 cobalt transport protein CbiN [Mycolicibacterium thermoresistibile]GAT16356.1 cobalt transport protein component CbiN [Mycolicibacterium thermoresistibile]SNW20272.1 Energy-coupling factor transporter probable substrate-capture protein CbiN [Mycolicibacterium thermoresistibile]